MDEPKLIVFEGIDGAGTTTQAKLLFENLNKEGIKVHLTAEPSTGPIGKLIRAYLKKEERFSDNYLGEHSMALLFASDRLEHLSREILPALEKGNVVISDRYLLSSLVYQSIVCKEEWVSEINKEAKPPDFTILLDCPPEVAQKRVETRLLLPELFEDFETQKKVRERYLKLARKLYSEHSILVLDATRSIKELSEIILREVKNFLQISR